MCKTGHSFIKKAIKETQAVLAGEMSGHIFFNDTWYGFDDALYAAARLLSILNKQLHKSGDFFAQFPNSVNTPEINLSCQEGENHDLINKIVEDVQSKSSRLNLSLPSKQLLATASVSTVDGLRIDFENGWGLLRASNTTPVLVARFEADDLTNLYQITELFQQLLSKHYDADINFNSSIIG